MAIFPVSGNLAASGTYPPVGNPEVSGATTLHSSGTGTQTSSAVGQVKDAPASNSDNNKAALQQAIKKINDFVNTQTTDVQFSIDESTHIRVVKVVDLATNSTIRQMPSEEILQLAKSLDQLQGLIVRQKA